MTEQNEIIRPRLSQLELFIIVDLLKEKSNLHKTVQSQTPYSKQVRRLRRKLKRNLRIDHANYEVVSNRVPYVKAEKPKAETGEKAIKERTVALEKERFFAFSY